MDSLQAIFNKTHHPKSKASVVYNSKGSIVGNSNTFSKKIKIYQETKKKEYLWLYPYKNSSSLKDSKIKSPQENFKDNCDL